MEKLKHCDKIYQEQRSATGKRPRLAACLEYVREGDTLVVTRLDRLARSMLQEHTSNLSSRDDQAGLRVLAAFVNPEALELTASPTAAHLATALPHHRE